MKKALITICSREKSKKEGLEPAIERYKSERIKEVYEEADRQGVDFFILSGEFGILSSDDKIPDYDHLLKEEEVPGLTSKVAKKLRQYQIDQVDFYTKLDSGSWRPYNKLMQKAAEKAGVELEIIGLDS